MKVSYTWLQSYFSEELPIPEELAELLTLHAFEVEEISEKEKDTVFDIDVLPNRAHDALSHVGVARDIAALTGRTLTRDVVSEDAPTFEATDRISLAIADPALCPRYSALVIENIGTAKTPDWLRARLESVGERAINPIVDVLNFVMLDMGQPLHAFDRDKLGVSYGVTGIGVREAHGEERIVVLGGEEYTLPAGTLVITDQSNDTPIAISGIKGGLASGVSVDTQHVVIESAVFDPVHINRTSRLINMHTGASTRFKNGITPELTLRALGEVARLINEITNNEAVVVGCVDAYPVPVTETHIDVTAEYINDRLGTALSAAEIADILKRVGCVVKDTGKGAFSVVPPLVRIDMTGEHDVAEEVGRVVGYVAIASVRPKAEEAKNPHAAAFLVEDRIRTLLYDAGFSEIVTSSFRESGVHELENPLSRVKQYMRMSLIEPMQEALDANSGYRQFLGLPDMRVFELGAVFPQEGEKRVLGIGMVPMFGKKNATAELEAIIAKIGDAFGVGVVAATHNGVAEIDLAQFDATITEKEAYAIPEEKKDIAYHPVSSFPFIIRDVALWVGDRKVAKEIQEIIQEKGTELLKRAYQFDQFERDGKVSLAFRLVFQSDERTLTDDEVNYILWQITTEFEAHEGWEVR